MSNYQPTSAVDDSTVTAVSRLIQHMRKQKEIQLWQGFNIFHPSIHPDFSDFLYLRVQSSGYWETELNGWFSWASSVFHQTLSLTGCRFYLTANTEGEERSGTDFKKSYWRGERKKLKALAKAGWGHQKGGWLQVSKSELTVKLFHQNLHFWCNTSVRLTGGKLQLTANKIEIPLN